MKLNTNINTKFLDEIFGLQKSDIYQDILTEQCNKIIDIIRIVIDEKNINSSYNLRQSIEVIPDGDYKNIMMDYYWKFINYGVSGAEVKDSRRPFSFRDKFPPVEAMKKYLMFKGLGNDKTLPYKLRISIFKKGIKPTYFIEEAIDRYLNENDR